METKLILGDCLEKMKDISDESIDLVLTDPPYGIQYLSPWTDNHHELQNDGLNEWLEMLPTMLAQFKRVLTKNGVCCCCCGGGGKTPVTTLFTIEAIKHLHLIQTLVWHKFVGLGWRYRPAYENIVILAKNKDEYNFFDTTKKCSNVITGINQKIPKDGEHPTVKPVPLMERLLFIHSQPGMTVLDPFMGSGTTGVACVNTNRNFIGIEIDEEYFKIAEKRIEKSKIRLF